MDTPIPSYRPGLYYYREAYRRARTQEERDEIFFSLCRRDEALRDWVRDHGLIPPKFEAVQDEILVKPWLIDQIEGSDVNEGGLGATGDWPRSG